MTTIRETTPQFIWRCLQKNMTVVAEATGKENKYEAPEFKGVPDERCWMCAGVTNNKGILVKDRITHMFSDVHLMRFPNSESLCEACYGLQSQRRFRFYSSLATVEEGVRHPARDAWADILTNPPAPPWAACLATSGQKHLFYRTQVNYQNQIVFVQMEDLAIRFEPEELAELLDKVERLYRIFTKDEILTGEYQSNRILQYGLPEFDCDEKPVSHYRGERLLELAVWIARRDEEGRAKKLEEEKRRNEKVKVSQEERQKTGQLALF